MLNVYVPAATVLFQRFPDGAVLYTPSNETYLGLNETGAQIWELLPREGAELEHLLDRVATLYPDAPRAELRADLTAWLQALVDQQLAHVDVRTAA